MHGDVAVSSSGEVYVSVASIPQGADARPGDSAGWSAGVRPPDQWKTGLVGAPDGVALNPRGDLFVSGFTTLGGVHCFNRK